MKFLGKLKESFLSVFPITVIVLLLMIFVLQSSTEDVLKLSISAIFLIIGIAIFSLGADSSMIELGGGVGGSLSKSKKLWLVLLLGLVIGFIITFAEPDLMVLAKQVLEYSSLSSIWIFISIVSVGVGILLLLGILRIYFKIKLSILLAISYGIVFILSFFVNPQFVPIAFDSGSVTTGPISVPFLIAFGLGLSAVRDSKDEEDNSFGMISLCSVGPIISVMILSLFLSPESNVSATNPITNSSLMGEISSCFLDSLLDVAIILLPIVAIFVLFQIFSFKYPKTKVIKMSLGFLMVYVGISLFLTGVEVGYLNAGTLIGEFFATSPNQNWIILISLILGAFAIIAEPALHVLKHQVEEATSGTINQKIIIVTISLGVALSVMLASIRALYPFDLLYILIPMYTVSIILAFINPKLITAIAFDSGGVATGSMAVSFILPMVSGLNLNGNGFGTIALIACFPIFTMQILGLIYKIKLAKQNRFATKTQKFNDFVVDFDYTRHYINPLVITRDDVIEFEYKKREKIKNGSKRTKKVTRS